MSARPLTEKEKRFITALIDLDPDAYPSERKRLMHAKELAGYSTSVSPYSLVNNLKEEIIRTCQEYAALNLPRGMRLLLDVIEGKNRGVAVKDAIKCVELLAGYAGLVKQEKVTEATIPTQVIVMPEKSINKIKTAPLLLDKGI